MCHVYLALPCSQDVLPGLREREIPDFSASLPLAMDTTVSVPTGVSSPSLSARLPFKAEILPLPDAKVQLL